MAWRPVAAYLVFALVFGGGLSLLNARQNHSRAEARRQSCDAILEQRQTLADVIALSIPPVRPVDTTLSPELQRLIAESQKRTQEFLDQAQARLSRPIPFCEAAGVDTSVQVHGATPLPVQVTTTPATTTTTRPALRGSSSPTTRPRGVAHTSTSRPAAPGPAPTTARPTPPTSRPCRVRVPTDGCAL